jgi:hypothetical protein
MVTWVFRVTMDYVCRKLEQADEKNESVETIRNCCKCYLDCFHRFFKYLNENAYIQLALTCDGFCNSGLNAYTLALKNSSTFFITDGIGGMLRLLGRIAICVTNTLLGYLLITYETNLNQNIDNPIVILCIIFLISWGLSSIFMECYSIVSLTILQCMYTDVEICK